jgi:inhibitor of cysteine peptidase
MTKGYAMNTRTVLPAFVILLLLTAPFPASCGSEQERSFPPTTSRALSLGAQDNGSSQTLRPGGILRVTLPANPTTGYDWHVITLPATHLELLGQEFLTPPDSQRVGAPGETVMEFQAKSPEAEGAGTLELGYFRSWEGADTASERYVLHLTVMN